MAYHQHQDYYQQQQQGYYPYQPQQQQQHYYQDDYAMQNMIPNHSDPYYQHEYNASNASTPYAADDHGYGYSDTKMLAPVSTAPLAQHSYLDKDDDRDSTHSRSCLDWFCCACCSCCPMWMRWCACGLLIIIIALGITIGVLAALFKKPQVNFNGVSQSSTVPPFQMNGTGFDFNFVLDIGVVNPNIESATFTSIQAIAYYPSDPTVPVGGGIKDDVHIGSNSITNITFPFQITYDPTQSNGQAMLADIATRCGILGGEKTDLTINYKLIVTVDIIGIKISPSISESASFPCPISAGDLPAALTGALGSGSGGALPTALTGLLPSGSVPSDIGGAIPTGVTLPSGVSLPASIPTGI